MAAENRSAHPNLPGVPWWAAVLIAVIGTTIGFAIDAGSGNKELGGVFAAMYALGCVVAVLAVRQSGIFTAVIQPPLILFVAVPGRLLPVPRRRVHRPQGHPDQLRLPADRTFPADAVHLGRCAADRDGPLVLRDGRHGRIGRHRRREPPRRNRAGSPAWRRSSARCSTAKPPTTTSPSPSRSASTASTARRPPRSDPVPAGPPSGPHPPDPGTPVPHWRTSPRPDRSAASRRRRPPESDAGRRGAAPPAAPAA